MCGIAGVFSVRSNDVAELGQRAARMADAIRHRGPDDSGEWVDPRAGIALAHRRLAVVDLTSAGHQPMLSERSRFVLAYNGEIYNHLALRAELESLGAAPRWRGHSDTETLLASIEHWGLHQALRKLVGMFAIALWDRAEETLHLARDRFGEKPLYFGWAGGAFVFGSELKALRAWPGFSNPLCHRALAGYMTFAAIPAPLSIYQGVFKLDPGSTLSIRGRPPAAAPSHPLRPGQSHETAEMRRWWSLGEIVESGARYPHSSIAEGLRHLETSLQEAIASQCMADVPLGAFLSGGVDSSLIVALMQEQARRPVKTFTVGFEESAFDESPHARRVALHLGTDHSELIVTSREAQQLIPELPAIYDEPFADSSQIPTHFVCRAARQSVTVALSGDAGDELFGGYNRYLWAPKIWHRLGWMPYPIREGLAGCMQRPSSDTWDKVLKAARIVRPGEKLHKLGRALRSTHSVDDLYQNLASDRGALALLADPRAAMDALSPRAAAPDALRDARARMMYWDSVSYLPDDILCKVDRAAMSVSLETRVPFLDVRVAEAAWRLPMSSKIHEGQGKWALRQLLYRRVPAELIERPKSGFALPVGEWLKGPLRPWAEDLLSAPRINGAAILDASRVRQTWQDHLSGKYDATTRLWTVLMLQAWLQENS